MKYLVILLIALVTVSCGDTSKDKELNDPSDNQEKESVAIDTEQGRSTKAKPIVIEGRYNVAFLIMDGTYNTELTAPFDIFQHTQYRENIKQMNVFTVANTLDPIRTFEGMYLLPDFDYTASGLPNIDILVIPSAEHHLDTDLDDQVMIDFVKKVDQKALYMTSHCDGAFVLAKAGLLDGKV